MAKGMPSMVALLGLLAVAGYQHRDKISDTLKGLQDRAKAPDGTPQSGLDGVLAGLGGLLGGGEKGLSGGLGDLLDSFKSTGQAEVADSWVTPGVPTRGLTPAQVEQAVGPDNLAELASRTGLRRDELLQRLATAIPEGVDRLTPDGKFPTEDEARQYFRG